VFESSYSPIHPRKVPRPPTSAYDQTSIILISHAHSDHLDPPTLRRFPKTAVILCPAPSEKYVRGLGPSTSDEVGDTFAFPGGTRPSGLPSGWTLGGRRRRSFRGSRLRIDRGADDLLQRR
jgi:L-ascorbate metabolism protein UlaG (beta-lactamase superfamily)